jgi:hypothetical protein
MICLIHRIIIAIGKRVVANNTLSGTGIPIRIDKPTPCGVIIPALEVIQPGLLRLCIAARAKMGDKKLEITGSKETDFYRPGRGVTSPGWWVWGTQENRPLVFTSYKSREHSIHLSVSKKMAVSALYGMRISASKR